MRLCEFAENIKIHPVTVSDHYRGETFGTKFLTVNGVNKAGVDVSIVDDEVNISHIITADDSKRKGYAKLLVDALFDEFPDRIITVSGMTDDGSAFFRSQYNVNDETGEITKKGSLSETSMIYARKKTKGSGIKQVQKFICGNGPRAGKRVSSIAQCSAPVDVDKKIQMKKTRARTKVRQARRAKRTKRIDPSALLAKALNKARRS